MARLEGRTTKPWPIILGAVIIALVAVGLFFAFRPAGQPAENAVSNAPRDMVGTDNTVSNEVSTNNSVSTEATPIEGGGSSTPIPQGTAGASGGGGGGATNSASAPGVDSGAVTAGTPKAEPTGVTILPTATSGPPAGAVPVPTMAAHTGAAPVTIPSMAPPTVPHAGPTIAAPQPVSTPAPVATVAGMPPRTLPTSSTNTSTSAAPRTSVGY